MDKVALCFTSKAKLTRVGCAELHKKAADQGIKDAQSAQRIAVDSDGVSTEVTQVLIHSTALPVGFLMFILLLRVFAFWCVHADGYCTLALLLIFDG